MIGRCSVFSDPPHEVRKGFQIYVVTSILVFLAAGAYIGWVFYSRWAANQAIAEKAAAKERIQDQKTFDLMGGDRFEILVYAANPPVIHAGEKSSLCYSVSNAKEVKIVPKTEEPVWPAYSRCVHVSPRETTAYTLKIGDGTGQTKTAAVDVTVR
jgi:hypothetical protein